MKTVTHRLLILIITLTSSICFSNEVDRFRQVALSFIDKAAARGHTQVEGLSIQDIRKAAEDVLIQHDSSVNVGLGNRRCAMWQPENNQVHVSGSDKTVRVPARIFLNKHCAELSDLDLEPIATHEVFGAKFKKDLKYEATTRMSLTYQEFSAEEQTWKSNRQLLALGGSTGVGGGGDDDDMKFKLEGLKTLERFSKSRNTVFGIPVAMLKEALHEMQVSPASDMNKFMQFRSRSSEKERAILFVQSHFYRSKDSDLGLWALYAARLFVLYSPYELGFVAHPAEEDAFTLQLLRNLRKEIVSGDSLSMSAYSFETTLIEKMLKTVR